MRPDLKLRQLLLQVAHALVPGVLLAFLALEVVARDSEPEPMWPSLAAPRLEGCALSFQFPQGVLQVLIIAVFLEQHLDPVDPPGEPLDLLLGILQLVRIILVLLHAFIVHSRSLDA